MSILRPCIECGELSESSRCPDHVIVRESKRTDTSEYRWQKLSRLARARQPFCTSCGSTTDLQLDHSPRAWARKTLGLSIRLEDCTVLCRVCNNRAGSSKPDSERWAAWVRATGADTWSSEPDQTWGVGVADSLSPLAGESKFRSQTECPTAGVPHREASWQG